MGFGIGFLYSGQKLYLALKKTGIFEACSILMIKDIITCFLTCNGQMSVSRLCSSF